MKYLWDEITDIKKFLGVYDKIVLLLDFDGTLTPIVKPPNRAELSKSMRNLLIKLSKKQGFYLAILSGRTLKDIKKKIGLPNIIYGGNHGLEGEIFGKKYSFHIPQKKLAVLKDIRKQLNEIANQFEGVFIEDKGPVVSLHYRKIQKYQIPVFKKLFKKILKPYEQKGLIYVIEGKMVYDIYPKVNWNKGEFAVLIIQEIEALTKQEPVTIFIGDDSTDEEVFKKLKKSITIKVGRDNNSNAKYNLNDTEDVFNFLSWINERY